ncbi:MAG TPA: hypothetical protein VE221_00965 [Sphingomicrobium sp.]|nr:hypothetical protein [Sphingomicrobium sp.]
MLHLQPNPAPEPRPEAYAEAISRLASVRHALRLVDPFGGGPASDDDTAVANAWDDAGEAKRRWFDNRSARLVGATAAGVEALLDERQNGREPHALASQELVEQIRRELAQVSRVILG